MENNKLYFTQENELTNELREKLCKFKLEMCKLTKLNVDLYSEQLPITCIDCPHQNSYKKGTILLVQGRAETIDKYLSIMYDFSLQGYRVISYDQPYQGYSSNKKKHELSWIGKFSDYLKVITSIYNYYHIEKPIVIAISMGGMITIQAINKKLISVSKMVLITPMIRITKKGLPSFVAKPIAKVAEIINTFLGNKFSAAFGQKKYEKPKFENNYKTHSIKRLNFYHKWYENPKQNPLGGVTWRWLYECYLNEPLKIDSNNTKVLFLEAEYDHIVDNAYNDLFIKKSTADIDFHIIHNSYHDLLNETDDIRNKALEIITKFLECK